MAVQQMPSTINVNIPSNSNKSKQEVTEMPVIKHTVTRKKHNEVTERFQNASQSSWKDVIVPGIFDILKKAAISFIEAIFKDISPKKSSGVVVDSGPYIAYNNIDLLGNNTRRLGVRRIKIDQFTFRNKTEAENVILYLQGVIKRSGKVAVGHFYNILGIDTNSSDFTFGWYDLENVDVIQTNEGYIIDFPPAEELV